MSSIGSVTVFSLSVGVNPTGMQTEIITAPGRNGVAVREDGRRADPFYGRSVEDVADEAAYQSRVADYKALEGSIQTVVDDLGRSWTNVLVRVVIIEPPKKGLLAVGGLRAGLVPLIARWTFLCTEVS